jgi:hypothetical protein
MPQERHNPVPFPIASEVEAAPGTREIKAARNIMVRNVRGVPSRDFLLGNNDHAPILRAVSELTGAAYELIDAVDWNAVSEEAQSAAFKLRQIMEHHGCPETRDEPVGVETLSNE